MLFLANGVRVCFQVIPSRRQQVTEWMMVDSKCLSVPALLIGVAEVQANRLDGRAKTVFVRLLGD